jgi:1,4-dihydroxy-2-naphthoate octaprenyltransferase
VIFFRRLLATPLLGALLALFAGAAAAHDLAVRPRFDLLAVFTFYVLAVIALEIREAHPGIARSGPMLSLGAIAGMAGVAFTLARGWPAFWIACAIALLALAFVAGPRLAETSLGGLVTVAVLGPLSSAGAALALSGEVTPTSLWIGLPVGLLADAARRARETAAFESNGPLLAPSRVGTPEAPPWFTGDLVGAYGIVPALVLTGTLPWPALVALLTLPWAVREAVFVRTGAYAWGEAARRARRLHLVFAVLLALGVLAARAVATRVA